MKNYLWALGGAIAGAAAATVGTYLYAKKRFTESYIDLLEEELAAAKKHYSILYKRGEYSEPFEPEKAAAFDAIMRKEPIQPEQLQRIVDKLRYDTLSETPNTAQGGPYVISVEEWSESDSYEQKALTYFIADDTLAGEDDEILSEDVVGSHNLDIFGRTGEEAIYVRDVRQNIDYEITKSNGSYSNEVHGEAPEKGPREGRFPEE